MLKHKNLYFAATGNPASFPSHGGSRPSAGSIDFTRIKCGINQFEKKTVKNSAPQSEFNVVDATYTTQKHVRKTFLSVPTRFAT